MLAFQKVLICVIWSPFDISFRFYATEGPISVFGQNQCVDFHEPYLEFYKVYTSETWSVSRYGFL